MGNRKRGTLAGIGAFIFWGFVPLYWKPLAELPAWELVLHRIVWAFVFIWPLVIIRHRSQNIPIFPPMRTMLWAGLAGVLVSANWLVYVWAVTNGRTLDASLGYYISPLVSVALGTIFLRERLDRIQTIAVLCAISGVVYLTLRLGAFPWLSLTLALTFGIYGLLKKRISVGSVHSLALELTFLVVPALLLILWREGSGVGVLTTCNSLTIPFVIGTGALTVIPLMLFGYATRNIELTNVGFIQFIGPTLMMVVGITFLKERLDLARLPGFGLVWIGLLLFSIGAFARNKKVDHQRKKR